MISHNEIQVFVLSLLTKKNSLPRVDDVLAINFYKQGLVDSVDLIKFVLELEEEFNIDFSTEDMVDSNFKTIGGLCDMIMQKL